MEGFLDGIAPIGNLVRDFGRLCVRFERRVDGVKPVQMSLGDLGCADLTAGDSCCGGNGVPLPDLCHRAMMPDIRRWPHAETTFRRRTKTKLDLTRRDLEKVRDATDKNQRSLCDIGHM
jgi:hypothetical protein